MNTKRLRRILKSTYPLNHTLRHAIKMVFGNGLAVFLFVLIFKPFGLVRMVDMRLLQIAAGFGMVCSLVLAFDLLLLPNLLPGLYRREGWKVWHQALRVAWQISAVAVVNVVYAHFVGAEFQHVLRVLLRSHLAALIFALAPISLGLVSFRYRTGERLSSRSENTTRAPISADRENDSTHLVLKDEHGCVKLRLKAADVLCLCAAQNYVEVVFLMNGHRHTELVRNSLKRVETELRGHPTLVRCHRGYLVNLEHVVANGASSSGRTLLLITGLRIPVSRRRRAELRKRLIEVCQVSTTVAQSASRAVAEGVQHPALVRSSV